MLTVRGDRRNVNWQWSKPVSADLTVFGGNQGWGQLGFVYQTPTSKALPNKDINATSVEGAQSKGCLLVPRAFSWEFSSGGFQVTCTPRMTDSPTRSTLREPRVRCGFRSSKCRLQPQQFQPLLSDMETKTRRWVLLWRAFHAKESTHLNPRPPDCGYRTRRRVPAWHAALPVCPGESCPPGNVEQEG